MGKAAFLDVELADSHRGIDGPDVDYEPKRRDRLSSESNPQNFGRSLPSDQLLPEEQVLKFRPCLSRARLRGARNSRQITWVSGKRGKAWYRLDDVDRFIVKHMEKKCHDLAPIHCSSLAANGSPTSMDLETSTDFGMTPDLEEHVASRLAQRI